MPAPSTYDLIHELREENREDHAEIKRALQHINGRVRAVEAENAERRGADKAKRTKRAAVGGLFATIGGGIGAGIVYALKALGG